MEEEEENEEIKRTRDTQVSTNTLNYLCNKTVTPQLKSKASIAPLGLYLGLAFITFLNSWYHDDEMYFFLTL